jgi:hypothetical protein
MDDFASFQSRLAENKEEHERVSEEHRQALSMEHDESEIDAKLDGIMYEYRDRELEIFADEIGRRFRWVRDHGGNSHHAPDIVVALQAIKILIDRVRYLEEKLAAI